MKQYPRITRLTRCARFALPALASVNFAFFLQPSAEAQEIELSSAYRFDLAWWDQGSGANRNGSFWVPRVPAGQNIFAFGHAARDGYAPPPRMMVGKALVASAFAPPTGFTWVWNDSGSGADLDGAFWNPIPPPGYVSLGTIHTPGTAPAITSVVCVRSDLVVPGTVGDLIWNDAGSGAHADFSAWKIDAPAGAIDLGTYIGTGTHAKPAGPVYCLKGSAIAATAYAVSFNGSNQNVRVAGFGAVAPTSEITIEFWQRAASDRPQNAFVLDPEGQNNRISAEVPGADGTVGWDFGDPSAGGRLTYTPPASDPMVGTWQHFAFVASQSGNFMRIYRNGVQVAAKTGMTPFSPVASDLLIGGGPLSGFFEGELDEVRIWNVARDSSRILSEMDRPLTGNEPGLSAYWPFEESGGTIVRDATGGGHTGTLLNDAARLASTAPISSTLVAINPRISIGHGPGNITINFEGTLQGAEDPGGPFTDIATPSPYVTNTTAAPRFFYRAHNDPQQWQPVAGESLVQISAGTTNDVWGLDASGSIFRLVGGAWTLVPGPQLKGISVGADGEVWGINAAGGIVRRTGNDWATVAGTLKQIAVGSQSQVWGVTASDQIVQWSGSAWNPIPGSLSSVSVAGDGSVWGVNAAGQIYRWTGSGWAQIAGEMRRVSVGSQGKVWGINSSGQLWRWGDQDWLLAGNAAGASVAADGSTVWNLDASGLAFRLRPVFTQQIKLLTYNTHLFDGSVGATLSPDLVYEDSARIERIAQKLKDSGADIVALQEVWSDSNRGLLRDRLVTTYPYSYIPPDDGTFSLPPRPQSSGLMLLSKWPLLGTRYFRFNDLSGYFGDGYEDTTMKGVISATLAPQGYRAFRLAITHAGSDMGGPTQPNIRQLAEEGANSDLPAIMMGDFNVHRSNYELMDSIFHQHGGFDLWQKVHGNDSDGSETIDRFNNALDQQFSPNWVKPSEPDYAEGVFDRIDYAYVTRRGDVARVEPTEASVIRDWKYERPWAGTPAPIWDLSDHFPLMVTVNCTIDTTK